MARIVSFISILLYGQLGFLISEKLVIYNITSVDERQSIIQMAQRSKYKPRVQMSFIPTQSNPNIYK